MVANTGSDSMASHTPTIKPTEFGGYGRLPGPEETYGGLRTSSFLQDVPRMSNQGLELLPSAALTTLQTLHRRGLTAGFFPIFICFIIYLEAQVRSITRYLHRVDRNIAI